MTLSICIATYNRPKLLMKLLMSLINQNNIEKYDIEIIVIENDERRASQDIIEEFSKRISGLHCFTIKYDIESEKNISLTRNKGLSLATGEYIYFIDDDEYADENWIYSHLMNLSKYSADAAFGQVLSYFNDNIPNWIRNCYVYNRPANPSGTEPANLNTGNCIIKSKLFKQDKYFFDPAYGITGGSDYQLFVKMINNNAKFVSCREAITYEFVPDQRANIKWLIKRVFRTGNNFTRILINQKGNNSIWLRLSQFGIGIIQSILALLFSIFFFWNRTKSLDWFLKSVSNISKPFAVIGIYPQEYKKG